jgi:G2/mitotic-specific cyclin 2
MVDYLVRPVCHDAFFKKYASKKFYKGKSGAALREICQFATLTTVVASIVARHWAEDRLHMYPDIQNPNTGLDELDC